MYNIGRNVRSAIFVETAKNSIVELKVEANAQGLWWQTNVCQKHSDFTNLRLLNQFPYQIQTHVPPMPRQPGTPC